MSRRLLPLLAVLALLAPAAVRGEGLNLAWNNCANGVGASDNFAAACDDESQVAVLVGSFLAPAGIDSLLAMEASVTVMTDGRSIPDFWQLGDGSCRSSAGNADFNAGSLSGCTSPWGGQTLGIWRFTDQDQPPGRPLIRMLAARTKALQLSTGREYFAFKFTIALQGAAGCQGCRDGACMVLNMVKLEQPAEMDHDVVITTTAFRNYVTWQGGGADCPGAKANKKVSWSQVKAHYR